MPTIDDGRHAAWLALVRWADGDADAGIHVGDLIDGMPLPDERERGFARELALGAVRFGRLYDWLAGRLLKGGRQPTALIAALRLICHQLFALDRVPEHAAVGETVAVLRRAGHGRVAGVANAVGRRLAGMRLAERQGDGPLGRLRDEDLPVEIGLRLGLPDRLIADLRPLLDADPGRDLAALNRMPPLCTRLRVASPRPVGRSVLRSEGEWMWWDDPQEALRGPVADGRCVVQDRSQGEVADLAFALGGIHAGSRILDLCAAPGGKALALADRGCRVIAADRSPGKVRDMAGHWPDLSCAVADGLHPPFAAAFDGVLVDAPCSNSGVLARRPEARWRYTASHLDRLEARQRGLLRAASRLVAEGGCLIYSTCSLAPRENQGVAHRLSGWRLRGERLTWPDRWQAGGYVAVLVRSG